MIVFPFPTRYKKAWRPSAARSTYRGRRIAHLVETSNYDPTPICMTLYPMQYGTLVPLRQVLILPDVSFINIPMGVYRCSVP